MATVTLHGVNEGIHTTLSELISMDNYLRCKLDERTADWREALEIIDGLECKILELRNDIQLLSESK